MNIFLQGLYFSKRCNFFYIGLLCFSLLLIIVTIIDGFVIADSALFISLEMILNFMITLDFLFRIKLAGGRKFFRSNRGNLNWWNVFDTFVVISCNLLFILAVI